MTTDFVLNIRVFLFCGQETLANTIGWLILSNQRSLNHGSGGSQRDAFPARCRSLTSAVSEFRTFFSSRKVALASDFSLPVESSYLLYRIGFCQPRYSGNQGNHRTLPLHDEEPVARARRTRCWLVMMMKTDRMVW